MSENNQGVITGRIKEVTPYQNKKKEKRYRIDVVVPAVDEYSHPTTVSVHTSKSRKVDSDVSIEYFAMTFFQKGTTSDVVFDNTRLVEIED